MGKALILMAYGFGWGYVFHAKGIDKKLGVLARDTWDELIRHTVRVQLDELEAPRVKLDIMPDSNLHPEGVKVIGVG